MAGNQKNMPDWKRKRVAQLRKQMLMFIAAVAVIIVVLILVISKHSSSAQEETAEADSRNISAETTPEATLTLTAEPTQEATETPEAVQELTEEAPALAQTVDATIADRSNFAVQPGVACGSNTDNGEKTVYLTLDDGPSELTEQVLDICDQYNIKITFFVTNENPEYAYMIKEAYDRGHTIGLHSYSHDYATIYTSVDAYFQDLDQIGQVVQEQIGYVPCFIRFPGGSANGVSADYCQGIMTTLSQEVQNRGYQYFDWTASSGDGGDCTDPAQLAAAACQFDYDTNVVLLSHDGAGHEATIEALPTIIEHYLSLGYVFRPIDRNTYDAHQTIYN